MRSDLDYLLRIADSTLILGQRLSEWCGHAPALEEDLALTNVALDLIGQARLLLTHVGTLEGAGRDEDQLAFLRTQDEFRNATLVELPNGDFAQTIVRAGLFSAFQCELWHSLTSSCDAQCAAIAAKSLKESRYHWRHTSEWIIRLGDGTEESHARAQAAVDKLWPYAAELFTDDAVDREAAAHGLGPPWSTLEQAWSAVVLRVIEEATLSVPAATPFRSRGKQGVHSEHLGHLLSEMQYLQRAYPGAAW
jgi:ring-1,2-phenylacetyl-CoA epoxidase subunit PaaC